MAGMVGQAGTQQRPQKNPFDMLMNATGDGLHPAIDMLAKSVYGPKMKAASTAQIPQVQPMTQQVGTGIPPGVQMPSLGAPPYQPPGGQVGYGNPAYPRQQLNNFAAQMGGGGGHGVMGKFKKRFNTLLPFLLQAGEPMRIQAADAAALGGQTASQAQTALMARHGLSGSGADVFGQQAIQSGTQAQINQALIDMYEQAIQNAYEGARGRRQNQVGQANPHNTPPWADYAKLVASIGLMAAASTNTDPTLGSLVDTYTQTRF